MAIELTDDEARVIGFALACRIDDYGKDIKRQEKRTGQRADGARKSHAELTRITYSRIIPGSLSGDLPLMDGTTLRKGG